MPGLIAIDVGGTHVRFARAETERGRVMSLSPATTFKTGEFSGLEEAWARFRALVPGDSSADVAIAVAAPVGAGGPITLTNCPWRIDPDGLAAQLGVERVKLVNDFGAIGHALAAAPPDWFRNVCGSDAPFADVGTIAVVGPGTGLGVACVVRHGGAAIVVETEGGHIDFAPIDAIDDAILAHVRRRHGRASVERIVSGPGLATIHAVLAERAGVTPPLRADSALWATAFAGEDPLAAAALDRFCLALGSVAGDIALAQGASGVVIAGGLGLRLGDRLAGSSFAARFAAKGRFAGAMAALPVKRIVHPEPGLHGAAAAFAREHGA